jgi:hypothetical protein
VSELYKEDLFGDLLYEDDGIKAERECEAVEYLSGGGEDRWGGVVGLERVTFA